MLVGGGEGRRLASCCGQGVQHLRNRLLASCGGGGERHSQVPHPVVHSGGRGQLLLCTLVAGKVSIFCEADAVGGVWL